MARCSSCNKFCSLDAEVDVEENGVDITAFDDGTGATVTTFVTLPLACAECGTVVLSAELEIEAEAAFDTPHPPDGNHRLSVESDGWERTERYQTTHKGRPIKNPRYQKHFYGVATEALILCSCCGDGPITTVTLEAEEQASYFQKAY